MIPYFQFISFQVGSLTIYVWGVFVALGILTGFFLLHRQGFFKEDKNLNLIIYLIFAAIIGGRLGHILFYDLSYFLENPIDIFKIWQGGMSSFGGFLVAVVV
ncbi:MAG: prolipoprotein diacylglyceryl transferase family protein, partial [Nanoarchaeota archaeon]|nr:prolipoprotein diacylglyceryl transferase family protein [Nanoarchaeota archaeon]